MKSYTITVNGNVYDVTVEEKAAGAAPAAPVQKKAPVAPKAAPAPKKAAGTGNVKVTAGAAGKVFKLEAAVGQQVEKGAPIVVIEAMKMEIPVVAPQDGTLAQVVLNEGDPVEVGDLIATMN